MALYCCFISAKLESTVNIVLSHVKILSSPPCFVSVTAVIAAILIVVVPSCVFTLMQLLIYLEGLAGFEPATSRLRAGRYT
jgi:hypothetical protein